MDETFAVAGQLGLATFLLVQAAKHIFGWEGGRVILAALCIGLCLAFAEVVVPARYVAAFYAGTIAAASAAGLQSVGRKREDMEGETSEPKEVIVANNPDNPVPTKEEEKHQP